MDLPDAETPPKILLKQEAQTLKHFINHALLAPNVLTVPIDLNVVSEFAELARISDPGPDFHVQHPWKRINDMKWITADTEKSFRVFESAFERLDVARHVRAYLDLDEDVRFYAGFLHIRTVVKEAFFHVDWQRANNEGFTLLTPISGCSSHSKLLYKKMTGEEAEYRYNPGEAIIFGDHFIHSSPPGQSDEPLALLVLNFGTDKIEHWGKLLRTQGFECPLIQRPDGKFLRVDPREGPKDADNQITEIVHESWDE